MAAGALIFLRGDVAAARETAARTCTPEQVRETMRMTRDQLPYYTPGYPLGLALEHKVRIGSMEGPAMAIRELMRAAAGQFVMESAPNRRFNLIADGLLHFVKYLVGVNGLGEIEFHPQLEQGGLHVFLVRQCRQENDRYR